MLYSAWKIHFSYGYLVHHFIYLGPKTLDAIGECWEIVIIIIISFVLPYTQNVLFLVVQMVKDLPAMQETWVWSPGWVDPLEKGMATHSSILAWRIPQTEKPGGIQSMKSQRVGHDWMTNTHAHIQYNFLKVFKVSNLYAQLNWNVWIGFLRIKFVFSKCLSSAKHIRHNSSF